MGHGSQTSWGERAVAGSVLSIEHQYGYFDFCHTNDAAQREQDQINHRHVRPEDISQIKWCSNFPPMPILLPAHLHSHGLQMSSTSGYRF